MGVISDAADEATEADAGPTETRLAHRGTPDPFLPEYDVSSIKLDADSADQILGLAVVVSNIFR